MHAMIGWLKCNRDVGFREAANCGRVLRERRVGTYLQVRAE